MKKILKIIIEPILQKTWFADFILFTPRLICGFYLTKDFGADKFGMPWSPDEREMGLFEVIYWFPRDVEAYGGVFAEFPVFFAWMGAFAEAVGGLLLLLGFNTRISGFLIVCTMLVAIFFQKWQQVIEWGSIWGILPAMGFLWVGLYAMILGSGRFGIDYLISKNMK
ncbi:MAG: DoxX family protein [Salibacteraceae bacterium]